MKKRIHIFGASGSGTTTIAKCACSALGYKHFDSDSYFWAPSAIPFSAERLRDECVNMMNHDLSACERWLLSGSLTGWGDALVHYFDLVVFVYVPRNIRLSRLEKREYERYGGDIKPGGSMYESSQTFLEWAGSYDEGTQTGRSLHKHEKWLEEIKRPVLRITNVSLDDSVNAVLEAIISTVGNGSKPFRKSNPCL